MGPAEAPVVPFPDDPAILHEDGPHHGIGTHPAFAPPGKAKGPLHIEYVFFRIVHRL
jgi:hypothetical protein